MRRRFILAYVVPVLALLVGAVLGPILGRSTFYLRDVANAHAQTKIAQAALMRSGQLPLVDPYRDGQPLVGNPNAVALYPDNLLFLAAPTRWAFDAHLWLHLLLAPFAMYGLGRACGLRRPPAWVGGTVYATSGFAFSHLNLYNSIAAMALAPALVAAAIHAARARPAEPARRPLAAVAALAALLVVGGDPPTAALAFLLAASAAWAMRRRGRVGRRAVAGVGVGLVFGLLLAAPQIIELQRIRGVSFRGARAASAKAVLAQSFDPRASAEWAIPLVFGPPDRSFWGTAFYGGNEPFYLSLYPGVLALALVLAARRRTRAWAWAWAVAGSAVFVALGSWNPVVRGAVEAVGGGGARYPIKAWLAVAIAGSLLCGLGFERWRSDAGRRGLIKVFGGLSVAFLVAWQALAHPPARLGSWLAGSAGGRLRGDALDAEVGRWAALAFLVFTLTLVYALLAVLARGRRPLAAAGVLTLHVASQLFFLGPLLDTDDASFYRQKPELAGLVPDTPWLVHGRAGNLFGPPPPPAGDPDDRTVWEERRRFASLAPQAGVSWGFRYAFDPSPEGLDTFWSVAVAQAVRTLPDDDRLRILEAFGVATLILDRPLEAAAASRVGLIGQAEAAGRPVWVYKLPRAAPSISVVHDVRYADDPNITIRHLRDPAFDPRHAVVVAGDGQAASRRPGRLDLIEGAAERVVADVDSPEGTTLVLQRAWLPLYRASVDGEPVPVRTANLARIAVDVPAGLHRVRVWVDRRPFVVGRIVAGAGWLVVAVLVLGRGRGRTRQAKANGAA